MENNAVAPIYQKANIIIGGLYKTSLIANRVMAISLAKIKSAEEDEAGSLTVHMNVSELRSLLKTNGNGLYDSLNKAASELTGKSIGMSDEKNRKFTYIAVVTMASYAGGVFTIEYNKALNHYLKDLNSSFTLLDLSTMLSFASNYSFRLYEYIKSRAYAPKGTTRDEHVITISLAELKMILGTINADQPSVRKVLNNSESPDYEAALSKATDQSFTDFRDFKKRIITPALAEINEKTDLDINAEYQRSGYGGKVNAIEFHVKYKTAEDKNSSEYDPEKIRFCNEIMEMFDEDITLVNAIKIAECADYNMELINEKYELSKERNNINDIVSWMLAAIKDDYKKVAKMKKVESSGRRYSKEDYAAFEQLANIHGQARGVAW